MHPFLTPGKRICICTEPSDRFWAAVLTQLDPEELCKPVDEQQHEPLAFLGSAFKVEGRELDGAPARRVRYIQHQAFKKQD